MKRDLVELYNDTLLLADHIELKNIANEMLPALYPGRELEGLSDEELIVLIKAVITGMTSWVC
ncbi:hypothetical protein HA39_19350 [Pantoea brenneri]|nr:hypothetical protein HA39_19350 [Pantoea brenneri]